MTPLIGFAPDLPPETPGIFTDCQNILPGLGEFEAAKSLISAGLPALSEKAVGFAITRKNDDTRRVFCGTASALYEASTTWTDVSKSGGYELGAEDRWRFAQFGNQTIAAAKAVTMQASSSGVFADLSASAPKAAIVETINNQVFAFNTTDAGFGDDPTRWWCSAVGDSTDWSPSVATQCVSGQLLGAPGPITAGKRLGNIIVAYKARSIFVGQYVGTPSIWDWQQVPGQIGTPCQEAVVNIGTAHYFIGADDFYVFDGTRPIPMNSPLRKWLFDNLDRSYAHLIVGVFDSENQRIFWWIPTSDNPGVLTKCVVLNIKTNQWGRFDVQIEIAAEYIQPGVTIDELPTTYPTIDELPADIPFDSPFWLAGDSSLAAFKLDHAAYTATGTPTTSSIHSGHFGDNQQWSSIARVKPRFIYSPTYSQLLYSYSNTDASSFTQNITSAYQYGWYDLLWSAMWHKFELQFTGPMRISGYDVTLIADGTQ